MNHLLPSILLISFAIIGANAHTLADDPPERYIMDILSNNPNYSKLILTIQRSGLLEYVTSLENITFIAASNEAFDTDDDFQYITQEDFQRYVIDELVYSDDIEGPHIYNTQYDGSDTVPHLKSPILLDMKDDSYIIDGAEVFEKDIYVPGQNSIINGINQFLLPKQDLCDFFKNYNADVSVPKPFNQFSKLMIHNEFCHQEKYSNLTALIPCDDSFSFDEIELNYFLSSEGQEDKSLLVDNFFLYGLIGGSLGNESIQFQNLKDESVLLKTIDSGYGLVVNDNVESYFSNYVVSDAVVHFFDSMIYPEKKFPLITPRKYLIGLNQSTFTEEIDYRGLSELIDDVSLDQTIFLNPSSPDDISTTSSKVKNTLLYSFVNTGNLDLSHSQLVTSKFCTSSVIGHCHRLKILVDTRTKEVVINDEAKIISPKYQVGNTSVYFIDDSLSTPSRLIKSVSPKLKCTRSLNYFSKFKLLNFDKNNGKGYTIFLPTTGAWTDLDLTLDYLVSHPSDLRLILENLIVNGLIYDDFVGSKEQFTTLNNEVVEISKIGDDSALFYNHSRLSVSVDSEVLFHEGVAHPIQNVPFPHSLNIDMNKLLDTVDPESYFAQLLKLLGMEDVIEDDNYSFIVPTSKSLNWENSTNSFSDLKYLETLIKLHILPGDSVEKLLRCEDTIPTLLNGTHLSCRETSGNYMLQIKEGSDHEVRVLRKGFTTSVYKNGLFLIDRPISPKWLDKPIYEHPIHIHLPLVAILTGVIIGVIGLLLVLACCFVYLSKTSQSDSHSMSEDPEREPLMSRDSNRTMHNSNQINNGTVPSEGSTVSPRNNNHTRVLGYDSASSEDENVVPGFSENRYSTHSSSKPIAFQRG